MPASRNRFSCRLVPTLTLGLLALSLAACSIPTTIANQRQVAPENLEIAKRRSLAFIEFTGEEGGTVSRSLVKHMSAVRIDGERLFHITGPIALGDDGDRHTDEAGISEPLNLAKKLGTGAVLLGRITLLRDDDLKTPVTISYCTRYVYKNKKKKMKCAEKRSKTRRCANVSFVLKYKVLALETASGRRIYDPGVRQEQETRSECVTYSSVSPYGVEILEAKIRDEAEELRREMLDKITRRIYRDIAPYIETFVVQFLDEPDSLDEGPAKRFATAVELVDDQRLEAGCAIWRKMVDAGQRDPAIAFNLGACAEQQENYRVAWQFYTLTQRYADQLQARAGDADRNYSYQGLGRACGAGPGPGPSAVPFAAGDERSEGRAPAMNRFGLAGRSSPGAARGVRGGFSAAAGQLSWQPRSSRSRPWTSPRTQRSSTRPSLKRKCALPSQAMRRPLGGTPSRLPWWVPEKRILATTRSASSVISRISQWKSGSAATTSST